MISFEIFAEVDRIPQRARILEKSGRHRCPWRIDTVASSQCKVTLLHSGRLAVEIATRQRQVSE